MYLHVNINIYEKKSVSKEDVLYSELHGGPHSWLWVTWSRGLPPSSPGPRQVGSLGHTLSLLPLNHLNKMDQFVFSNL